MDVNGHICTEPAYDQFGRLIGDNPKYRRSRCLNSLSPIIPPENRVTLVIEAKVAGGYLTCQPDAEDNVIRTTRTQVRPIQVHTLEKVSNDESGDFFEMQDHFYPMLHKMLSSKQDWKTAPYIRGRPDFEVGIMEWTESILLKFEQPLKQAGIYGAVSSPSREKKIDASPERDSPTHSGATLLIESDKEEEFSPVKVAGLVSGNLAGNECICGSDSRAKGNSPLRRVPMLVIR